MSRETRSTKRQRLSAEVADPEAAHPPLKLQPTRACTPIKSLQSTPNGTPPRSRAPARGNGTVPVVHSVGKNIRALQTPKDSPALQLPLETQDSAADVFAKTEPPPSRIQPERTRTPVKSRHFAPSRTFAHPRVTSRSIRTVPVVQNAVGKNMKAEPTPEASPEPKLPLMQTGSTADAFARMEPWQRAYHVVYGFESPRCSKEFHARRRETCSDNPRCVFGLGEQKRADPQSIWHPDKLKYAKDITTTINSLDIAIDQGVLRDTRRFPFAGLTNLGATCYISALLQVLYHNREFRRGIFNWVAPTKASTKEETLVLSELQLLFSRLSESALPAVSPTELVSSALMIATDEQQDVQEFNKLFLSLIDDKLRHDDTQLLETRCLIPNLFKGERRYVTTCMCCRTESRSSSKATSFFELEVNLVDFGQPEPPQVSLQERLRAMLQEETLTGDNRYYCEICRSREDATRKVVVDELPDTLNIQLMRFSYDMEKDDKVKIRSVVQFPDTMDVGCILSDRATSHSAERRQYRLTAVCLHKGSGAHSGHYVAQLETTPGHWWEFDDQVVTQLPSGPCQEPVKNFKQSKKPMRRKSSTSNQETVSRIDDQTNYRRSPDAYMLVYTRERTTTSSRVPFIYLPPPTKLADEIKAENASVQEENFAVTMKRRSDSLKALKRQHEYFRFLELNKDGEDEAFVSTDWLRCWITGKSCADNSFWDSATMTCWHGNADPHNFLNGRVKRVSVSSVLHLMETSGISNLALVVKTCPHCCQHNPDFHLSLQDSSLVSRIELELAKQKPAKGGKVPFAMGTDHFLVSKAWMSSWRKSHSSWWELLRFSGNPDNSEINDDILCAHSKPRPNSCVLVSPTTWAHFVALFLHPQPSHLVFNCRYANPECQVCLGESESEKQNRNKRREALRDERSSLRSLLRQTHNQGFEGASLPLEMYLLPGSWASKWQHYVNNSSLPRPEEVDMSQLHCNEHQLPLFSPFDLPGPTSFVAVTKGTWAQVVDRFKVDQERAVVCRRTALEKYSWTFCSPCSTQRVRIENDRKRNFSGGQLRLVKRIVDKTNAHKSLDVLVGTELAWPRSRRAGVLLDGVSATDHVGQVKLRIYERLGFPPAAVRLVCKGSQTALSDSTSLYDAGISLDDVVCLVLDSTKLGSAWCLEDEKGETSAARNSVETGFAGTGLVGKF